jgi:hypothetical protein
MRFLEGRAAQGTRIKSSCAGLNFCVTLGAIVLSDQTDRKLSDLLVSA